MEREERERIKEGEMVGSERVRKRGGRGKGGSQGVVCGVIIGAYFVSSRAGTQAVGR